jgi:hypothetical protein
MAPRLYKLPCTHTANRARGSGILDYLQWRHDGLIHFVWPLLSLLSRDLVHGTLRLASSASDWPPCPSSPCRGAGRRSASFGEPIMREDSPVGAGPAAGRHARQRGRGRRRAPESYGVCGGKEASSGHRTPERIVSLAKGGPFIFWHDGHSVKQVWVCGEVPATEHRRS